MFEKDGEIFPQKHVLGASIFQEFKWPIFHMALKILLMKIPVVPEKLLLWF